MLTSLEGSRELLAVATNSLGLIASSHAVEGLFLFTYSTCTSRQSSDHLTNIIIELSFSNKNLKRTFE